MKKAVPFILVFILLTIYVYPTFYYSFIEDKVYDSARAIATDFYKYRRVSLSENKNIGFYFDINKSEYLIFEDIDKNGVYSSIDEEIDRKIIDNSKVVFSDMFKKLELINSTIVFNSDATCSLSDRENDESIFLIYKDDKVKKDYSRMIRLKIHAKTCEIKVAKVISIVGDIIHFEN